MQLSLFLLIWTKVVKSKGNDVLLQNLKNIWNPFCWCCKKVGRHEQLLVSITFSVSSLKFFHCQITVILYLKALWVGIIHCMWELITVIFNTLAPNRECRALSPIWLFFPSINSEMLTSTSLLGIFLTILLLFNLVFSSFLHILIHFCVLE